MLFQPSYVQRNLPLLDDKNLPRTHLIPPVRNRIQPVMVCQHFPLDEIRDIFAIHYCDFHNDCEKLYSLCFFYAKMYP